MNKKILLLGCSGEVGFRLSTELLGSGYIVYGVRGKRDCKITNPNHRCIQIDLLKPKSNLNLEEFNPEIMIHTAWITEPKLFWNSPANLNWVKASKRIILDFEKSGGKYLLVTSTCAEYSWSGSKPIRETAIENPNSIYGKSKLELLNWLRNRDLPFLWTRTFFQFGLNELAGRLIPSLIDNLLTDKKYVIQNSQDIRDFIYIEDVVQILKILIVNEKLGVFNIGTGNGIKVQTAAQAIANLINREDLLQFETSDQPTSIVISNPDKLLSTVGNYPWTDFESALTETINFRRL
jgi:nucleoside-diphosphate-sugar epimerase